MAGDSLPYKKLIPARGVLLFLIIWLLVLLVPPLRREPWGERRLSLEPATRLMPYEAPRNSVTPDPNTVWADFFEIFSYGSYPSVESERELQKCVQLIKKYPHEDWLPASILRKSLALPQSVQYKWTSIPEEFHYPDTYHFTPNYWKTCRQIARTAAENQPQNAFYPICEAYCSQILEEEASVRAALLKSSSCSEYKTFQPFENIISQRFFYGTSFPPLEIRMETVNYESGHPNFYFGYFASLKRTQGEASWRRGNKRKAVDYFEQSLAIPRAQLKSIESTSTLWAGRYNLHSVWGSLITPSRLNGNLRRSRPKSPDHFIKLLRQANRPDLVPAVILDSRHPAHSLPPIASRYELLPDATQAEIIKSGVLLGAVSARFALWAAALWFVLGIVPAVRIRNVDFLLINRISLSLVTVVVTSLIISIYYASTEALSNMRYPADLVSTIQQTRNACRLLTIALVLLPLIIVRFLVPHSKTGSLKVPQLPPFFRAAFPYFALATLSFSLAALTYLQSEKIFFNPYLDVPFMALISFLPVSAMAGLRIYTWYNQPFRASRERFSWVPLFLFLRKIPRVLATSLALIRSVAGSIALSASITYLTATLLVAPFRQRQEDFVNQMTRRGAVPVLMETFNISP